MAISADLIQDAVEAAGVAKQQTEGMFAAFGETDGGAGALGPNVAGPRHQMVSPMPVVIPGWTPPATTASER